jgi:hypothetical protein
MTGASVQQDNLRWSADDATKVVNYKLLGSLTSCYPDGCPASDPVLAALNCLNVPSDLKASLGSVLIENGTWSATPQDEDGTWLVEVRWYESSVSFYTYEKTGLVEAAPC